VFAGIYFDRDCHRVEATKVARAALAP